MVPSPWLYAFLRKYEQFRPTAYRPTPRDVWTIGFGHTAGVKEGDTCTLEQAEAWLEQDAHRGGDAIARLVKVPLTQNQYDALCSLVFNCGPEPLEKTLGRFLNAGEYYSAGLEFLRWNKQKGRVLPGLTLRRQLELEHYRAANAVANAG